VTIAMPNLNRLLIQSVVVIVVMQSGSAVPLATLRSGDPPSLESMIAASPLIVAGRVERQDAMVRQEYVNSVGYYARFHFSPYQVLFPRAEAPTSVSFLQCGGQMMESGKETGVSIDCGSGISLVTGEEILAVASPIGVAGSRLLSVKLPLVRDDRGTLSVRVGPLRSGLLTPEEIASGFQVTLPRLREIVWMIKGNLSRRGQADASVPLAPVSQP